MDGPFLERCHCYFGGGTAVVLLHGEYRLSLDVDFLCNDTDGYRCLRTAAAERGPHAFFGVEARALRDFRIDQYGLRTMLDWNGQRIKFEIVREARISLTGHMHPDLGIPILSITDQIAEKLLANADRSNDPVFGYRDAIDLGHLVQAAGGIPADALRKVEAAYGTDIGNKLAKALQALADPVCIGRAAEALQMTHHDVAAAVSNLRKAAAGTWPDRAWG